MSENSFVRRELSNGLQVVMEPMGRVSSAAMGFGVLTGSRDETEKTAGISHFLEHMVFKGTARRDARQINLAFDEVGAIWNAYTEWELTAYYGWAPADQTENLIDLLSDMMRPALPAEEFETEKKVILEEIAMYLDMPASMIFDYLMTAAWGLHPLGNSVLGTMETVSGIDRNQMKEYAARRYQPANMRFVITGKVDPDQVVASLERHVGEQKVGGSGRTQETPVFAGENRVMRQEKIAREHLTLAWPAPKVGDDWEPTAQVLARILGDATNSRLFWSVIQEGLADDVSVGHFPFSDAGMIYLYASVDPDNIPTVLDKIDEAFSGLRSGVSEEELTRSKNRHATGIVASGESPMSRWGQLMEQVKADAPLLTIEQELAAIDAISTRTIGEYLERFPLEPSRSGVALGPMSEVPGLNSV